ncbi:hypothetical protein [Nocardioides jishulii]|uniref:DUF4062 domain-containing protein n=1 Tax=Nocardioides jishulii TaxID=2575440 RepID=A0A4U2YNP5_9ACTN|nr:hypothetical protein [Nocardioides jishulii]QCX26958.1 hypothetical protein FCL41_05000 [Nocardioides jishulii]TKI61441.1 hypothetical protein FC770_11635 [Nocardioides jishulii]
MSYNALVTQILLSSPSDLDSNHRQVILDQTRSWNADHGRIYGVHFSVVDWKDNAAASVGDYAQAVLNDQIVEESDAGLVVFTDRMGTPTRDYLSGTAEEIDLLLDLRRDVAVLRNECPRPPVTSPDGLAQKEALDQYVESLHSRALVKSYTTLDELRREIELVLTFLARKQRREADAGLTAPVEDRETAPSHPQTLANATVIAGGEALEPGLWPRVEVSESPVTDSRGRLRTKRRWSLVIESTLPTPVSDISLRFEDGAGALVEDFDLGRTADQHVELLPPRGSVSFPLLQALGSRSQAMCVVTWHDAEGTEHETRASVRTG